MHKPQYIPAPPRGQLGRIRKGDESGLRVACRLHWQHTVASDQLTWYGVHGQSGLPAFKDHGILTNLTGTAMHDCWGPYWRPQCKHGLCNAHLLRDMTSAGCFRTMAGAHTFCAIRSYLDTMHKQGHNMFEVLRQTFIGRPPSPDSG